MLGVVGSRRAWQKRLRRDCSAASGALMHRHILEGQFVYGLYLSYIHHWCLGAGVQLYWLPLDCSLIDCVISLCSGNGRKPHRIAAALMTARAALQSRPGVQVA